MVDSIKSQTPVLTPSKSKSVQEQSNNTASLRDNFKSLSSGLTVAQAANDTPAVVNIRREGNSDKAGRLKDNLNDAVRFSNEALRSLENIASDKELKAEKPEPVGSVQELAADLDRLKSDIVDLLDELRSRAETADLISENYQAAGARLEDVEKAQTKAQSTSSDIQFNSEQALNAHSGELTLERVQQLLSE